MHLFKKPLEVCACVLAGRTPHMGLNTKKEIAFRMDGAGGVPIIVGDTVCLGCGASEEAVMVTMRLEEIEWATYGKWDGDRDRVRRQVKAERGLLYKGDF